MKIGPYMLQLMCWYSLKNFGLPTLVRLLCNGLLYVESLVRLHLPQVLLNCVKMCLRLLTCTLYGPCLMKFVWLDILLHPIKGLKRLWWCATLINLFNKGEFLERMGCNDIWSDILAFSNLYENAVVPVAGSVTLV